MCAIAVCCKNYDTCTLLTLLSFSPTVVVVGFVDTLVEVNESDGQATLNVSITSPLPVPWFWGFDIMFNLSVASMEGSAGMDEQTNHIFLNSLP